MSFHLAIAYGVAAVAVAALVCMGHYNQRSGWRRERKNEALDILITWAAAQAENREQPAVPLTLSPPPAVSTADQLTALGFALGANAGMAPVSHPGVAERSEVPISVPVEQGRQS